MAIGQGHKLEKCDLIYCNTLKDFILNYDFDILWHHVTSHDVMWRHVTSWCHITSHDVMTSCDITLWCQDIIWSVCVDSSWQNDFGAKELYNTSPGRYVNAQAFFTRTGRPYLPHIGYSLCHPRLRAFLKQWTWTHECFWTVQDWTQVHYLNTRKPPILDWSVLDASQFQRFLVQNHG